MTSIETRIDVLTRGIADEIRLMEEKLAESSVARTASASALHKAGPIQATADSECFSSPLARINAAEPAAAAPPLSVASPPRSSPTTVQRSPSSPSAAPPPAPGPSAVAAAPEAATSKEGTLLHLVRSGGLFGTGGTQTFVPHYVVVTGSAGIAWYASRVDFLQQPQRPLGRAAFWIETHNSRGSRFKKAAVCWPLVLREDCPAATDASKTYFAVDYYASSGEREQLVLAADSPEERDAWVQLLTRYIDLYLAPRAESEELQHITRGAAVPLHRSGVIEGEAPGGTIL
ncbi:hypothetical protein ABB37_01437 [Leptomonas pyrrhocoris]|uniref:PH domain-containing protein n=1 Tax=Leptomonas pyrrhocoris TaxID=157538 RepID=A0A0M9G901_LEPPY|nr:hypothetical protein ABB37_01437 [Leptomonas pyrrhocoris]KPA85006.1 hypothetical protein ABB37_01437 [Leptomonas pyrrhocoris]|eukprot:XP_015663445.1 hypothetical protein ABB37_01437 [Leptomonas pyrrhocoris]